MRFSHRSGSGEEKGAGVISTITSLTNCIIGSGVLALPYAFRQAGIWTGQVLLVSVALAACFSFFILVSCSDYYKSFSYRQIAQRATARQWPGFLSELFCCLYTLGTISGYGVVISDYLIAIVETCGVKSGFLHSSWFLVFLAMLVAVPLSMLPKLDFLKYTSFAALLFILFVVCIVVYHLCADDPAVIRARGKIIGFNTEADAVFGTLPLLGVAFTAHYNCLSLYKELFPRKQLGEQAGASVQADETTHLDDEPVGVELETESPPVEWVSRAKQMSIVIAATTLICVAFYLTMGDAGYALFRDQTRSNVLLSFENAGVEVLLGRIAVGLAILFSYPVVAFALKRSICTIFIRGDDTPRWIQCLICGALGAFVYVIGGWGPGLDQVLRISGTLFGSVIVYILPGIFFTLAGRQRRSRLWLTGGVCEIIFGIGVFVLGLYSIISNLVKQRE